MDCRSAPECETCLSVKLRKMALNIFICPEKLIIGRTLEIWQLDVLMKIISNLIFTAILILYYKSEMSRRGKRQ